MKRKIIYNALYATMLLTVFTACGDDSPAGAGECNGLTYSEAFQGEQYQEYADALTNFTQEQTPQSCEVYKTELTKWYNVLAGISSNCLIGVPEQEYEQALAEFQQSIDELDCSEYEGN